MKRVNVKVIATLLFLVILLSTSISYGVIVDQASDFGYQYNFNDKVASLSTYVSWTQYLRTNYERLVDPIGQGRGGYYWGGSSHDWLEPGYCCELLCNGWGKTGVEIFDFPITEPIPTGPVVITMSMTTPDTHSWYQQGSYDVFINDHLVGVFTSPSRGESEDTEIVFNSNVLKQGNNNVFIVFNEDRSAYGILTKLFWVKIHNEFAEPPPSEFTNETMVISLEKRFISILEEIDLTLKIKNPRDIEESFTYIVTAVNLSFRGGGYDGTHQVTNNITLAPNEAISITLSLWYEISAADLLSSVHTFDVDLFKADNPDLQITDTKKEWVWVYASYGNMQKTQISQGSLLEGNEACLYETFLDKGAIKGYIKFTLNNSADFQQKFKIDIHEISQFIDFNNSPDLDSYFYDISLESNQVVTHDVWFNFSLPNGCIWGLMPFKIGFSIETVNKANKEFVIESHREYDIGFNRELLSTTGTYEENDDGSINIKIPSDGLPSIDIGVAIQSQETANTDPLLPVVQLSKDFLELLIPPAALAATLSGGNPKLVALYWGLTGVSWFLSTYIFLSKINIIDTLQTQTSTDFPTPAFSIGILFFGLLGVVILCPNKRRRNNVKSLR